MEDELPRLDILSKAVNSNLAKWIHKFVLINEKLSPIFPSMLTLNLNLIQ